MIEVNNLTTGKIDEKFLKRVAKKALEEENKKIALSIALVDQNRIKELNRKYRKKNQATDVLSFQYDGWGEVVICPEAVKKNAKQFKSTYQKELARVLIHGIWHILGYTHQQMKQKHG